MRKYYLYHSMIVVFFTTVLIYDLITNGFILTLIAGLLALIWLGYAIYRLREINSAYNSVALI